jgi:DNA-binding transcriptional regulator YdaS (Cro superfamily)
MPDDTAFNITAAGLELFGQAWPHPLASLLGLNPRTVQRWANGQNAVPAGAAADIAELLTFARRCRAANQTRVAEYPKK